MWWSWSPAILPQMSQDAKKCPKVKVLSWPKSSFDVFQLTKITNFLANPVVWEVLGLKANSLFFQLLTFQRVDCADAPYKSPAEGRLQNSPHILRQKIL